MTTKVTWEVLNPDRATQGEAESGSSNDKFMTPLRTKEGADQAITDRPATQSAKGISFLGDQNIAIANSIGDPLNDIDFSGGKFIFDDGTGEAVAAALTKQIDANWVAGDNVGGLDTGVVADGNFYFCYAIHNPTSGISDYLFSLSFTAPTMPAGYTKKSYRGPIFRAVGGLNFPHKQFGREFVYDFPFNLLAGAFGVGNVAFATLAPPLANFKVGINARSFNAVAEVSIHPTFTTVPLANLNSTWASGNWTNENDNMMEVASDLSAQIQLTVITNASAPQLPTITVDQYSLIDHNIEM